MKLTQMNCDAITHDDFDMVSIYCPILYLNNARVARDTIIKNN